MSRTSIRFFTSFTSFTAIASISSCLLLSACAHPLDVSMHQQQRGPLADFDELVAQHPSAKTTQLAQASTIPQAQPSSPKTGGAK